MEAKINTTGEAQIYNLISSRITDILRVEPIEEAFNCVIVHGLNNEEPKSEKFYKDLATAMTSLTQQQKENVLRQYLIRAATQTNLSQMNILFDTLLKLVNENIISARILCEQILNCEKLVYQNQHFWISSFRLIKKILPGVDYKGVREIMKCCTDRMQTFPYNLSSSNFQQMLALNEVIEYIFDRNACLLPAYFIVNEIKKFDNLETHWKSSELISNFIEGFRDTVQMLTIIGHSQMRPVVEHSGYEEQLINQWRLDPNSLKFTFKGNLPYDSEILRPQTELLSFVLSQPYSRDMTCSILNLQKQIKERCVQLEEQFVCLLISAMERSEQEANILNESNGVSDESYIPSRWQHLYYQLIYFVLFNFASFPNLVHALHDKLVNRNLRKGRDHLMWVLLQYISGIIQKNPLSIFLPILKLYDILYPEEEPLPVPDYNKLLCTYQMAPVCIWIHLLRKAQVEHFNWQRPIPKALKLHYDFLQHLVMPTSTNTLTMGPDFRIPLLCNAYSTNQELFSRPMSALVDTIIQNQKNPNSSVGVGGGGGTSGIGGGLNPHVPTVPLSICILDGLSVHTKMSLIHSIVTHMIKQAQMKSTTMAPALIETYARLLVYTDIESLGVKGFLTQLLPNVFKPQAWGILHTLLEMFSYRMHHIQPHYRVQLLSHLHSLAVVPLTNQTQLHLCVESTALRLITGLGSVEVQPQLIRYISEPKTPGIVVSTECEELNRALILTLARSMHITGTGNDKKSNLWCKDLLNSIVQNTPHTWAQHTLQCFPPVLNEFFVQHNATKENRQHLKKAVDEEYRKWASMSNENDIITHFSVAVTPPLFLCLLFKMIFETDGISAVAYKILERIGARALSAHLRKLCDYLVFEVANSADGGQVNKFVDTINDMIWKYNVVTIDRLVLCLVLRPHEGSEAQVCFYIIQLLLLKAPEFRNRLLEFVKENSPEHWKQNNWHEKHLNFHQKYPEKFAPDDSLSHPPLPVFFGNVCLRFLPVLDIVIHRFIEIPIQKVHQTLEVILEHLGCLYKFHDRPVTYLYNTLHYYEKILRENPPLKKKMVSAVIGSLKDVRPANWALSESYMKYIQKTDVEAVEWIPELTYYIGLVRRMVDTFEGKNTFPPTDWRFNEFPNPPVHALYITCVELLGLPVGPQVVANSLLDVMTKGYTIIPSQQVHAWINAIGLIMTSLPESYWGTIYDRLQDVMTTPQMSKVWTYRCSPFEMFNFKLVKEAMLEKSYVMTLAMTHSILHHSGTGQISTMSDYIKDKLKPIVRTEYQLIYLCHLIGPFLQRYEIERSTVGVVEVTTMLYEIIEQINKNLAPNATWQYMDPICDLLYHIKYMFIGDSMKAELEAFIRRLRPALQRRLRFITHLNVDEINSNEQQQEGQSQSNGNSNGGSGGGQTPQQQQQQQASVQQSMGGVRSN